MRGVTQRIVNFFIQNCENAESITIDWTEEAQTKGFWVVIYKHDSRVRSLGGKNQGEKIHLYNHFYLKRVVHGQDSIFRKDEMKMSRQPPPHKLSCADLGRNKKRVKQSMVKVLLQFSIFVLEIY